MIPFIKSLLNDEAAFRYLVRSGLTVLGLAMAADPEAFLGWPAWAGAIVAGVGQMVRSAPRSAA